MTSWHFFLLGWQAFSSGTIFVIEGNQNQKQYIN